MKTLKDKAHEQILGFDKHLKLKQVHRITYDHKDVAEAVQRLKDNIFGASGSYENIMDKINEIFGEFDSHGNESRVKSSPLGSYEEGHAGSNPAVPTTHNADYQNHCMCTFAKCTYCRNLKKPSVNKAYKAGYDMGYEHGEKGSDNIGSAKQ